MSKAAEQRRALHQAVPFSPVLSIARNAGHAMMCAFKGKEDMPHNVSLMIGGRRIEIAMMVFVAGWLVLAEYANEARVDDELRAVKQLSLPLYTVNNASDQNTVLLACVETLCRILGDKAEWSFDDDLDFFVRNRSVVVRTSTVSACLNEEVIEDWRRLSAEEREEFVEFADGLIFASVVAHGQSQE